MLLSPEEGSVHTYDFLDKAESLPVDRVVAGADVADYDALVPLGG